MVAIWNGLLEKLVDGGTHTAFKSDLCENLNHQVMDNTDQLLGNGDSMWVLDGRHRCGGINKVSVWIDAKSL